MFLMVQIINLSFFNEHKNFDMQNSFYTELDINPFTVDEIICSVKLLKRNKAYGGDNLLNEYFIETVDILAPHICNMFNTIIDSVFFPDIWSNGIIVPIHKKGFVSDVNNYRGITLVSCLSKLFTSVLKKRIEKKCNEHNLISYAQFGF